MLEAGAVFWNINKAAFSLLQAKLFVTCGVDKIRLTGGEPTVRRDIVELTSSLSSLPGLQTLAMTTNGLAVSRKLENLKAAGMCHLN